MHSLWILYWQGALLLKNDVIVASLLDSLLRVTLVPMHSKRSATCRDQSMRQLLPARLGQLRNKFRNIVTRSKAIADEQYVHRGKRTPGHIGIPSGQILTGTGCRRLMGHTGLEP